VDSSLLVLTKLRIGAGYRRWKRSLSRPRGILVSVVFALLFMPSLVFPVVTRFMTPPTSLFEPIERFGPIGFFVVTILSLFASTGDTVLYFTPAEVDFLFAGPYRRRQLIGYKLAILLLTSLFMALFVGMMSAVFAPRFPSAFLGSLLALLFFYLSQMALGLGLNTIGTLAWSRTRRWGIAVLLGVVVLAIAPSHESLVNTDWKAFGLAVERSPVTLAVLTPFRWFVNTYTAKDWTSLATWGCLALAVDLALVVLVFALDAGYLEASSLASSRLLARNQKMIGGGGTIKLGGRQTGRFQLRPPNPVWWGGVGPNFWRQMTSALGNPARLVVLTAAISGIFWLFTASLPRNEQTAGTAIPIGIILAMPITLFLSLLLSYDFRGDVDVIETLKMLPISPAQLAFSQVLTPAILSTAIQAVALLGLIAGIGGVSTPPALLGLGLAVLFPANLYYYAVENLLFLWYPTRVTPGQFDGMAAVRQLLLLLAKGIAVGVAGGVATAVGAGAFFLFGRQVGPALVLAWLTLAGLAMALMPLLGRAFVDFDVSRDVPA